MGLQKLETDHKMSNSLKLVNYYILSNAPQKIRQ